MSLRSGLAKGTSIGLVLGLLAGVAGSPGTGVSGGGGGTPSTASGLPLNLNSIFSAATFPEQPFVNVAKHSRSQQDIEYSPNNVDTTGVSFDNNGYAMTLPVDPTFTYIRYFYAWADAGDHLAGDYIFTYDGVGTVQVRDGSGTNIGTEDTPGIIRFTLGAGANWQIQLRGIGNPADYPRNWVITKVEDAVAYGLGKRFSDGFLNQVRLGVEFRFMNSMHANVTEAKTADDWPRETARSYDPLWPVEMMVALANEADVNPWFCLPLQSEQSLVQYLADYVRDNLKPGLKALWEYANELWNSAFLALGYLARLSVEERLSVISGVTFSITSGDDFITTTGSLAGLVKEAGIRIADRIFEIKSIDSGTGIIEYKQNSGSLYTGPDITDAPLEYGLSDSRDWATKEATKRMQWVDLSYSNDISKYYRVLATHQGNPFTGEINLNPTAWQVFDPAGYVDPKTYFHKLAITSYWGNKAFNVAADKQALYDAIVDPEVDAFEFLDQRLRDPSLNWSIPAMGRLYNAYRELIAGTNLDLILYEGGNHIFLGLNKNDPVDVTIAEFMELFDFGPYGAAIHQLAMDYDMVYIDGPHNIYSGFGLVGTGGMFAGQRFHGDNNDKWVAITNKAEQEGIYYGSNVAPRVVFPFISGDYVYNTASNTVIELWRHLSANTETVTSDNLPAGVTLEQNQYGQWQLVVAPSEATVRDINLTVSNGAGSANTTLPMTVTQYVAADPLDPGIGVIQSFNFTDASTITQDGNGVNAVANEVPGVTGAVGLVQTTNNNKPQYDTVVNGENVLRFNRDHMTFDGEPLSEVTGDFSMYVSCKFDVAFDFALAIAGNSGLIAAFSSKNNNLAFKTESLADGEVELTTDFDTTGNTEPTFMAVTYDSATKLLSFYVNDQPVETATLTQDPDFSGSFGNVGAASGGLSEIEGWIATVRLYNQAHTEQQVNDFRLNHNALLVA